MDQIQVSGPVQVGVRFDPQPDTSSGAEAGSLGGGDIQPLSRPVDVRLTLEDSTGAPITRLPAGATIDLSLPVIVSTSTFIDGTFTWLQALYENGQFNGYIRPAASFDPSTETVQLHLSFDSLQGTLFLPAIIHSAWVQNFDANAHIYSGPTASALDFGVAGPQFTTFTVVAPQIGGRLYVFDPVTGNYGWIDAAGVGPSGPPDDAIPPT